MTKFFTKVWRAALVLAACAISFTASADLLLSDSFNYPVGNLYEQGGWMRMAAAKTLEPVQVVDDALVYEGYQSTAVGKAVALAGTQTNDESLKKQFSEEPVLSGTLYYSLLVKPMEFPQTNTTKYVFAGLAGKNFNGWGDGVGGTSPYNTVSITKGSEDGKFKFGFDSSTSAPQLIDVDYDLGKTYLVVVGYDFSTKAISAWVNPVSSSAAPTLVLTKQGSISESNGVQGVSLYQQGSTKAAGKIVVDNVRVATDMASLFTEEGGEDVPMLDIKSRSDFAGEAAPINQDTRLMTFTVNTKNLEQPTSISLSGGSKDHFKLSTSEIPAGTGTYEVVLTMHPTAIGNHTVTVNFDAFPTTLSHTIGVGECAYDPENLPTITVPASVEAFKAAPKATDEKTITISSANAINYLNLALVDLDPADGGGFSMSTGLLNPNSSNEISISFKPLKPGNYTARIMVFSTMAETQYINLTGVCEGTVPPEEKEGGELVLDKTNPHDYLVENFDVVEHNKPLAKEGWDNVAMTGTRAWWGYNFEDEHGGAAKVTPYDSEATEETPCEMLLVTPALDFKNAKSKVFTCSVMGKFLPSSGTDEVLEVLYIEDKDWMQPFSGLEIPYISDQKDKWFDYVIDLEGEEVADVFFIGFRFKSTRGHSVSTTYFVDNVSWGRTDVPQVKADVRTLEVSGVVNETTTSQTINVKGLNLTGNISVAISGADKASFAASAATLPAEGGALTLQFTPTEEREYVATITLSADGCGPFVIEVKATGTSSSGVEDVTVKSSVVNAYDLMGRKVINGGTEADVQNLPAGIYIVNGEKIRK